LPERQIKRGALERPAPVIAVAAADRRPVEQPRVLPEEVAADEVRLRKRVVPRRVVGDVLPLSTLPAAVEDDGRRDARPAARERELAPFERHALDLDRKLGDPLPERHSPAQ